MMAGLGSNGIVEAGNEEPSPNLRVGSEELPTTTARA
jgi:hypothetical protein